MFIKKRVQRGIFLYRSDYPRFLLEDGARRPPSYYSYPILILTAKRGLGCLNSRPGSPCPGLQQPNFIIIVLLLLFLLVGGRGTETTVLLWYARLFTPLHKGRGRGRGCFLLVGGRGAETTALLWYARLFTPLHKGRGRGRGCFLLV